jgi:hypothetical protein
MNIGSPKFARNVECDATNDQALGEMGWEVLTVWEGQLNKICDCNGIGRFSWSFQDWQSVQRRKYGRGDGARKTRFEDAMRPRIAFGAGIQAEGACCGLEHAMKTYR